MPRDDELALKPTNPALDLGLGAFFLALLVRLLLEIHHSEGNSLGLLFAWCLAGTVAFSKLVAFGAARVGRMVSRMRRGTHIPEDCRDPLRSKLKQRKFADQAWQLAIHASMTCFELYLLRGTTWYEDSATCFQPCPSEFVEGRAEHSKLLRFFYVLQLAIWVWTGFSCKWIEARRKDYVEMMLHHCVTVTLILFSFVNGELAIGLVVLFVHDSSDIVLDCMKMCNYLKLEGAHGYFITEIFFVSNLGSWFYFRNWVFSYHVLYKGAWLGYAEHCGPDDAVGTFERRRAAGTCLLNDVGLGVLCLLHVFWFLLVVRIAVKMVTGTKGSQAGREEYEGASESDTDCDTDGEGKFD